MPTLCGGTKKPALTQKKRCHLQYTASLLKNGEHVEMKNKTLVLQLKQPTKQAKNYSK